MSVWVRQVPLDYGSSGSTYGRLGGIASDGLSGGVHGRAQSGAADSERRGHCDIGIEGVGWIWR